MAPLSWLLRIVAALLFLLSLETVAVAAPLPRDVALGPLPRWVTKPALHASAPPEHGGASETGIVDVLIDDQLHVTSTVEHYIHRVRQITSAAGVEDGAEIEVTFDPSNERFVLHGLHILRGSERIDASKTSTIRTFDSEDGREHQIYDGSRRVVLLLADLRPGDIVDFDASVVGANPVFGGRVTRHFSLASGRPALRRRVRVLSPSSRTLSFRLANTNVAATTRTLGTESEWAWEQTDVPAFTSEDGEPSWYDARPSVNISELASWAEVAQWANELYERTPPPSPALNAKIAELRAAHPTAESRAEAAVRFVQDDIRYLGIDLGEHSHRPHSASTVFQQRFGDCKDKVMLLVTMLRALGIDVDPALVNTDLGAHIVDELPSPQAFDHVIARLRLNGREIWVDPTRTLERGPLGSTDVPHGRGLIASKDTTDLSVIPNAPPTQPTTVVRETLRVATNGSALLEVLSTYRGTAANDMRYTVSRKPRSKMNAANLEYYVKRFAGVEARGELVVEDDEAKNVLVIRELYAIPEPAKNGTVSLWAFSLTSAAAAPSVTHRDSPLDLGPPTFLRHEIVIEGLAVALPHDVTLGDAALSFSLRSEPREGGGIVTYDLRTRTDSISVADLSQHCDTLSSIRDALDEDAHVSPPAPATRDTKIYLWVGLGVGAFFLCSIVVIAAALLAWLAGRRQQWRRVGENTTW